MANEQIKEFVKTLVTKPEYVNVSLDIDSGRTHLTLTYEWSGKLKDFSKWCLAIQTELESVDLVVRGIELDGPGALANNRHTINEDNWHAFPKFSVQPRAELEMMNQWFDDGIQEIIKQHKDRTKKT